MLNALLGAASRLPLSWLHAAGRLAGWIAYLASSRYAAKLRTNVEASGLCADAADCERLRRRAIGEAGKGLLELLAVWFRPLPEVAKLVVEVRGWDEVEAALARGRGILFLTPHLGCFDISALYAAARIPITVLYRPPKMAWLEPYMVAGRQRGRMSAVPTDLRGVRALYKALKRGEAVGLLPDQAPGRGEGVWADYFGRPAYTMTLAARLARESGAAVLFAFARRLPGGRGYALGIRAMQAAFDADARIAARQLNAEIESLVRECPEQYLWGYNRYKVPAGAEPPPSDADTQPTTGSIT